MRHVICDLISLHTSVSFHTFISIALFFFCCSIDLPVVKWAEKILSRARQGGVAIPNPEERQKILKLGPTGVATTSTATVDAAKKDGGAATAA